MSIVRKRSAAHKAYIPTNARDNQYILAEFAITDELIKRISPELANDSQQAYYQFYQSLSQLLFTLSNDHQLESCIFVANDKLVRVRYSQEMHQWQTSQQILFYYDPQKHSLQNSFFDANVRVKKITLLFLATGDDLRVNAANFHQRVAQLLATYRETLALAKNALRVRDHQHLTYDLFAKQKGCLGIKAHKLRAINQRYHSQKVNLPIIHSAITYAVINITINNHILNLVDIDPSSDDPYNPLYTYLTDTFSLIAKRFNLNNGALVANGLVPIIRYSEHELISRVGELQMLGYNPELSPCGIVSKWQADQLVDNVQLIFVATKDNSDDYGYGRFLNQIEQAMRLMATELEIQPEKEEIMVRFHQHVAYDY
ncbi:hypothetical protein tinsulaeT_10330 [Thalassotalea insulae]|uniref:DUF3083 family protein n=1 Tax=Thalassotalea insulae TaxID=2056778 RepID=A0ABQ6GNX7_9GAMM|nr:DUF3083 family protein [Thalassotalea insulae]GLX77693.1 hypothetical protein tinsulaeT_10330 [Thalassotalea insulae]